MHSKNDYKILISLLKYILNFLNQISWPKISSLVYERKYKNKGSLSFKQAKNLQMELEKCTFFTCI